MATKISGFNFVIHMKPPLPRPVIDATCSGMDLGYQILEPSCDFLELLGENPWMQKHLPRKAEKIEGESIPNDFDVISCFFSLFWGRGEIFGFIFGNPFGSDFATHEKKKSLGFSLNKGTVSL